ncbi:MAG: glycosyltransferase family 4 protein [bacterium]|nr:glycosyltransferase family 4 protein [bacterium]
MKVCLVTSSHSPFDDRVFYKEARSLKNAGYDVTIICSTLNYNSQVEGINIKGFKIHDLLLRLKICKPLEYFRLFWLCLKEQANIYHCCTFNVLFICWILKLIRQTKPILVNEVFDWYPETYLCKNYPILTPLEMKLRKYLDKKLNQRADLIITHEGKRERYVEYAGYNKTALIPEYPPLALFTISHKRFVPSNFVLGYAGGLSFARGINKLAESAVIFSKRNSVKSTLLLLGNFSSKRERKKLKKFCENNREFIDLQLPGFVPHPEVSSRLKDVDICFVLWQPVHIMYTQAIPIKLYEYMASGKPVIASNFELIQSIVESATCGICVDPTDVEAIAKAIEFYFKNPERISIDGKNGRSMIEKKYNWSICEDKLVKLYKQLLE